jgi:hypothetical protein
MIEALEAAILSKDSHKIRQLIAAFSEQSNSVHALVPLINLALKYEFFDLSLKCFEKAIINGLPEQQVTRFVQEPFFDDQRQLAIDFLSIASQHYHSSLGLKIELIKHTIRIGDYDDAISLLNGVLPSHPNAEILSLLSECYLKKYDFHSAKAAILLANELSPGNTTYLLKLASIEKLLRHFPASAGLLSQVIERDVSNHNAHAHLSYLALFSGEFELGWGEYEWHQRKSNDWNPPLPLWHGEQSNSYHLLVWSNNIFSEQILFLPLINRLTPQVTLKVTPQLTNLLPNNKNTVNFLPENYEGDYSEFDGHIPLSGLAKHFIKQFSDIPKSIDRIFTNAPKQTKQSDNNIKIGFSRIASETHDGIAQTLKLEYWQHLLSYPQCEYVVFENNICLNDQQLLSSFNISSVEPANPKDFTQLVANLLELDYLITVDNNIAHLAGALGIRALVFLPEVSNWYWFSGDGPSLWYPSMELSRNLPTIDDSAPPSNVKKAIQMWQQDSQHLVESRLKEIVNVNCDPFTTRTAS